MQLNTLTNIIMQVCVIADTEYADLVTSLTMIGKAAITASFSVIYVYTAELFPTSVRHIAVGSSSMMARIGGLVAPFMGEPLVSECIFLYEYIPSTSYN